MRLTVNIMNSDMRRQGLGRSFNALNFKIIIRL